MTDETGVVAGLPYDAIEWTDIAGQSLGAAAYFNGFILGDMAQIVDIEGPAAVAGDLTSARDISIGYGRSGQQDIALSATDARLIVGGDTDADGALTVVGNVVAAGAFDVGGGSSYIIGKDGDPDQLERLRALYAAPGGSPYWTPNDNANSYVIASYDVPRYIPASRVGADLTQFFADAQTSLESAVRALAALPATGTVAPSDYGFTLTGTRSRNVFTLDYRTESPFGNIALDTPEGSVSVVIVRTGDTLTINNPAWGNPGRETTTLFVFPDATTIMQTFPTVVYGSVLAPGAHWCAETGGGSINGNAVLRALTVQENSGFELHWFPFAGMEVEPEPCPIIPGVVAGCVRGCCGGWWRVRLLDERTHAVVGTAHGCAPGCFAFDARTDGAYVLAFTSACDACRACHACRVTLANVGVRSLTLG